MVTTSEYSRLSAYIYRDAAAPPLPPGWNLIETRDKPESGFYAEALQNTETGEIVVAFRGTNDATDLPAVRDLAPTILAHLGLPFGDMDGKPLPKA